MKMLNFWRNAPRRLPSAPLVSVTVLAGRKDPKPVNSARSRARVADTDGRARRRKQLMEDSRLL